MRHTRPTVCKYWMLKFIDYSVLWYFVAAIKILVLYDITIYDKVLGKQEL